MQFIYTEENYLANIILKDLKKNTDFSEFSSDCVWGS